MVRCSPAVATGGAGEDAGVPQGVVQNAVAVVSAVAMKHHFDDEDDDDADDEVGLSVDNPHHLSTYQNVVDRWQPVTVYKSLLVGLECVVVECWRRHLTAH